MLFLLLTTFTFVFAQDSIELDTAPSCQPYGVEFCYDCGFAQDLSSFATHPDMMANVFCVNCYNGYYPLAGKCYTMDELLADLTVSVLNDIAVFRSDFLLEGYKSMWTWNMGHVSQDYDVYDTLGYVAQEVLGDAYDYLFVSSYNDIPALACAEQTNEADCTYVKTCQWLDDETCASTVSLPDRYHTHDSQLTASLAQWQPFMYGSKLQGTIRYNYKRSVDLADPNLTAYDLMGTHFHEIAHNFLVHGMELNPYNPHWGYSVLERQSEMNHKTWLPEEVLCFETGESITSPESCPESEDGKRWLHFESSVENIDDFHFSDWELLPMGLLHPDDLAGQTFFFCASTSQDDELEQVTTETGTKVGCNSVVYVTPEEWAWGEQYHHAVHEWHAQEVPFRAAHMVLQGTDEALPTTANELNAYWKKVSDLLPELQEDFKMATRDHGELDFSMSEKATECYIFRDDHYIEGEYTIVGNLGAFTMEECEVHCTLNPDCTAWRGDPMLFEETIYEVTGEVNGNVWGVSWCLIFTGEVTFAVNENTQTSNAYGPNAPASTYWTGERVFPIPEGCEADLFTFPPTGLPTTAPSTEIPLCYFDHTEYGQDCSSEYPVEGEEITTQECEALCSQDEACLGWQYPTWCTLLKGDACHFVAGGHPHPVSFQKNPDYFPESCVNPPTPEPTTTAEPTLHPTMENGLAPCYYEFTDAQVTGGQWDQELDISEEVCEALCTEDPECVGYAMDYESWSSSLWDYVDRCYNYHGATLWEAGFYSTEKLSYKKVLPEPENCLPGWVPAVATEEPVEATLEPTETTLEPTMATSEPTEATLEPSEATLEPTEGPTFEPTEATLEPTEETLEPTMATSEPTAATEEPTVVPTFSPTEATPEAQEDPEESSQTAIKFTQVVSAAEVECEDAKDDVQAANAEALNVPTSSVDVSGCERRMLAVGDSANTYEFLISVLTATEADADILLEQVASSDYAEQVTERLAGVTVTSSSYPVVDKKTVAEEAESQEQEVKIDIVYIGLAAVCVIVLVCASCHYFAPCCGRKGGVTQGQHKANNMELVL